MFNVLDFLLTGEKNAITCKRLAELCHCDQRSVTAQISRLRQKGYVILSNTEKGCMGFYLPSNREEIKHFVFAMHSRIKKIKLATLSAEKMLKSEVDNG